MDSVKTQLENNGYAIIPNLLDLQECRSLYDGFWDFWKARGIERTDTSTWKSIYEWKPNHGMLIQHWNVGHMQAIWDVRSNPKVTGVFENIWGTDNLACSFDGMSMGLAPEITNQGWDHNMRGWLHLDQSPARNGFECVQGWVTPVRVEEGDASLTVLSGSHKFHAEFADTFDLRNNKADWYKLTPEHVQWYKDKGCQQVTITCPQGSMVLWESRTVHAGKGPVKGRFRPKNRMVAYISMMPDTLTPADRLKKQKAILEGRMTTHWASQRVKLFGKYPRTYGKGLPDNPEYELPLLTARGATLAGFDGECPLTIEDGVARKAAAEAWLANMSASGASAKRKSSGAASAAKKPRVELPDFPLRGTVENAVITFAGSIESDRTGATHGTKRRGFSKDDLVNIGKVFHTSTLYTVGSTLPGMEVEGHVLIVKQFGDPSIFHEICNTHKDYIDRHMWSYGKLKNKNARWNTNYADIEQMGDITNPDPAKRVPSLIPFAKVPHIAAVRERLSLLPGVDTRDLYGEVNIYRISKTIQGIGEHMDKEREMVIGLTLGTVPRFICFQAYAGVQPIGPKLKIRLDPGDMYFMDIVGKGTGSVMKPHIRHHATGGTGSEKFLANVVKAREKKLREKQAKGVTLNIYSQAIVDGNELFTDGDPVRTNLRPPGKPLNYLLPTTNAPNTH